MSRVGIYPTPIPEDVLHQFRDMSYIFSEVGICPTATIPICLLFRTTELL